MNERDWEATARALQDICDGTEGLAVWCGVVSLRPNSTGAFLEAHQNKRVLQTQMEERLRTAVLQVSACFLIWLSAASRQLIGPLYLVQVEILTALNRDELSETVIHLH